jgi:hypothetical protein
MTAANFTEITSMTPGSTGPTYSPPHAPRSPLTTTVNPTRCGTCATS